MDTHITPNIYLKASSQELAPIDNIIYTRGSQIFFPPRTPDDFYDQPCAPYYNFIFMTSFTNGKGMKVKMLMKSLLQLILVDTGVWQ